MLTQAPRGTRDVLPADSYRWQYVEGKMRQAAAEAGYREVRTPVFEHTELFLRGVGDTTDIVQKEMYTFKDKGDRSITLKPEGTAGAARCFLEGGLHNDPLPCKMYYLNAPIFRYENPQSGRLREHHQFGLECFGAQEATADAELILLAYRLLGGLGVKNLSVNINSIGCPKCRPRYHAMLKEYLGKRLDCMCETCRERFDRNPLRVLDCKEKKCQEQVKDAPSMLDVLCDECREHFEQLQACLKLSGIPYRLDSRIVGPLLERLGDIDPDYRILILSDHPTLLRTRGHDGGAVPFAIYDSRRPGTPRKFDEAHSRETGDFLSEGPMLLRALFEDA